MLHTSEAPDVRLQRLLEQDGPLHMETVSALLEDLLAAEFETLPSDDIIAAIDRAGFGIAQLQAIAGVLAAEIAGSDRLSTRDEDLYLVYDHVQRAVVEAAERHVDALFPDDFSFRR